MRKYWAFYQVQIKNAFEYRGASVIWRLSNLITLITFAFVWLSAESHGLIAGMQKSELITYYLLGIFLSSFVFWYPAMGMKEEINDGGISSKYLIKPVSYYWSKLFQDLGWHTFSPLLGILTLMIGVVLFKDYVVINLSLQLISITIISAFLGGILCFNISYLLGVLAFYTTEIEASSHILWIGMAIAGGEGIPVRFFHGWLFNLIAALPFRYIFSFPLEIYFGKLSQSEIFQGFAIQLFWILIFYLIGQIVWKAGLKTYTSYGN